MRENITFINLLDNFTPVAIRNNHKLPQEELVRTRAMLAILGFSIVVPLLLLIIYIVLQFVTENNFSKNIYILMLTEIVLISQHIYFQSYGNLRITAGVYSIQFLFVITTFVFLSGGLRSPLLILLVCTPMIAYMTMGLRAGLLHVAVVLLSVIGLLFMRLKSLDTIILGQQANYPYTTTIAWGVTLLILAIFLVVFEELVRSRD